MGPYRKLGIGHIAVIALLFVLGVTRATAASESAPLVSIAQDVIREAAKIGVNEAGTRVLGPTAWGYFKDIFAPVWKELEKRYPLLRSTGTRDAEAAAERAVRTLDKDERLQQTLVDGFKKLEEGQAAILVEVNRINETLRRQGKELSDIKALTSETLRELQQLRQQQSTAKLLEKDEFAKVEGQSAARDVIHLEALLLIFINEVLTHGLPGVAYSRILPFYSDATPGGFEVVREPTQYAVTAYGPFQDNGGQTCRRASVTYFRNGAWHDRQRTLRCYVAGSWRIQSE